MTLDKPFMSGSINEFIQLGELDQYTQYNFSKIENLDNIIEYCSHNVIEDDYLEEIKSLAIKYEFNNEQKRKYMYRPQLLAYDLYGNPELYFILMIINDVVSKKEFNFDSVYIIEKDVLFQILNAIYNAQKDFLEE